jgi:hypothetical protein
VRIGRALEVVLRAALAGREARVDRDRDAALQPEDLPAVQIFGDGLRIVESFVGGRDLVAAQFTVESVADRGELEPDATSRPARSGDDAATQLALCRDALMADRMLGGACLGLEVAPSEAGRAAVEGKVTTARVEAMTVSAYFTR